MQYKRKIDRDRLRTEKSKALSRKRGRRIILFNIATLIILMIWIAKDQGSQKDLTYYSKSVTHDAFTIRFSLSKQTNGPDYNASLSIKSDSDREKTISYKKGIASVIISNKNIVIIKKNIAADVTQLKFRSNEIKTFFETINISRYIDPPQIKKNNLGDFILQKMGVPKQRIPLKLKVVINTQKPLTIDFDFVYIEK